MPNVCFHVTDLDSLSWYHKLEDMELSEIRGRLLRTSPANDKMIYGTAWHSVLENPPDTISDIVQDGITFDILCDYTIKLPQVREIRAYKTYLINGYEVTLTGKCDGITGIKIDDHKLTFRENLDTYFESFQWRAYLDIFNADIFEYYIYDAKEKDDKHIEITDISSIKMFRYPDMVKDLEQGISDLLDFTLKYVPELHDCGILNE